jgi:DNA-directed RNA polymerase II subunit RPB2
LLHNTHFGLICPSETPEGQKIGIVKNFSLMAKVTLGGNNKIIDELIQILKSLKCEMFDSLTLSSDGFNLKTKIIINGNWVAFTDN